MNLGTARREGALVAPVARSPDSIPASLAAMSKHRPRPWHGVVRLKDELRTGELSLAEFAADLHEVTLQRGQRPVYEDPEKFFALTFPTYALRELVKDVAARLAGESDKAVRQLELTYGGGKTHTLITLYHLFRTPEALPDATAVDEFREAAGGRLPGAHAAALCFDKIDVERGIEGVRSPDGGTRPLRHPWSVLAYQLDGDEGLRSIHGEGRAEERDTPPAEPLLAKLLERPRERGLGTLILVDEVLMYARQKAGRDAAWRDRIIDFFQYLSQAVTKVDRAAMVASLLATDPAKQQGAEGQRLIGDLFDVFRRQREEGVQPVQREDVAEVLRRRFFEPESLRNRESWRSHAIGAVRELARLDETTSKAKSREEGRFEESFPFHPDLTDVFYSRWTQLSGFQRTRGILRTLATALREAESWDSSPLIGASTLLRPAGDPGISEAVRELASVAASESGEGSPTDWAALLEAELTKAAGIQEELPALAGRRESEQAVISVFLYSQPVGRKASTPELLRMVGAGGPDGIALRKGLSRWRELSWFLDDEDEGDAVEADAGLPKSWRLGNRPNLRQMHDEACAERVTERVVEVRLDEATRKLRLLTDGARAAGAVVHVLPASPRDVGDDGSFRYAVLGPAAVSESGKPSALARRYLAETTGADRPRVHRNALVLAVPSRDGLEAARNSVRDLLGWEDVQSQLEGQSVEPVRREQLNRRLRGARQRVPDAVRQAYSIVITVNADGAEQAFKLPGAAGPLFLEIKGDERARIRETPVDAEALLPGGPYDLWREDEASRLVKDLAGAFARYPHLPKMLKPAVVRETVLQGVERGLLAARLERPDGSHRTWWREPVDAESSHDPALEVLLPGGAELAQLAPALLAPGELHGLWPEGAGGLGFADLREYFAGGSTVTVPREGYEDLFEVPRCSGEVLHQAVEAAVKEGIVWLRNGPTSVWKEDVPYGALDEGAMLLQPPEGLTPQELVEEALPGGWDDGRTSGWTLGQALSQKRGEPVPWGLLREGIDNAVVSRWLEVTEGSTTVGAEHAGALKLQRPTDAPEPQPSPEPQVAHTLLEPDGLQDLAERLPELLSAGAGWGLKFRVGVVLDEDAPQDAREALNQVLKQVSEDLRTE